MGAGIGLTALGAFALLAIGRRLTHWRYQAATLAVAVTLTAMAQVHRQRNVLHVGDLSTSARGLTWLGYPDGSTWGAVTLQFAAVALVVTTVVVYLQVLRGSGGSGVYSAFAWALPLSCTNALTEELIFRAVPIAQLPGSATATAIACGVMFGLPHYVGTPGRIPGVLMAGFMGYIAAMVTIGTGGLVGAWLIHLVQDIPIFTMMGLAAQNRSES